LLNLIFTQLVLETFYFVSSQTLHIICKMDNGEIDSLTDETFVRRAIRETICRECNR